MHDQTLETWGQLTAKLDFLYDERSRRQADGTYVSSLLFRGQGDSAWKLETTLDRTISQPVSLSNYYRIIRGIQPKVETLSGGKWETPTVSAYAEWAKTALTPLAMKDIPAIPYIAYLRHHGFPSPLLDWTRSPYVAVFFAFRHLVKGATHASIYAYLEWAKGHKSATSVFPAIRGISSGYAVHPRHFMQQSEYTMCTIHRSDGVYYASHQSVFDRNDDQQDLLWKFNIPLSERQNVLENLSRMNINAFSLFGTEDSLLEELATTEFLLGRKT